MLEGRGFEVAIEEDDRLYRKLYRREVYHRYAGRCTDTKLMVFQEAPRTARGGSAGFSSAGAGGRASGDDRTA